MKWVLVLWFVMGAELLATSNGARILGIVPGAKSHSIMLLPVMKELANRGHDVTVISHYPQEKPIANYTDIILNTNLTRIFRTTGRGFERRNSGIIPFVFSMWDIFEEKCDLVAQEEAVQKLIDSTEHEFHLIIMEAFFYECFLGFAHKFKVPLIQICPFEGLIWMGDWFGNPNPFSYVPDTFLNLGSKMNFWERLSNTLMGLLWRFGRQYYHMPRQDAIMKKHFGHLEGLPYISDIEDRTSLLLVNQHFSLSYPKPLMPNIIQVGGLHVKPPKELPPDLKQYLDEAKDGVIYFSMGSNLQSSDFPESKKKALLGAFSKVKQKVLWKWEEDTLPGKPNNVLLAKWFPQADILAHPNVRVFMTHGGMLSTQEAINRQVPVIGIPVYGDQELNMARAITLGFGILLSFENITTESVSWALNEVIKNPRYRQNVQRISAIYRDQPLKPMDQAMYWIEYVIRHKGAPHMRSAVLDLTWYQYFLLDVIVVLVLAAVFVIMVLFIIVKSIIRKVSKCFEFKSSKINTEKKKS